MSSQCGELWPTWRVWGTPANFNGFRFLAALLHGTLVVGICRTLRRWTEGATYIRQGGHHVRHWPTFLVTVWSAVYCCSWNCRCTRQQWRRCARWLALFSAVKMKSRNRLSLYSSQSRSCWRHDMYSSAPMSTDTILSKLVTRNQSLNSCRYW